MSAEKGSALINQSMNADKGTAISRAKNLSFVMRNTLFPYIVFPKKSSDQAAHVQACLSHPCLRL